MEASSDQQGEAQRSSRQDEPSKDDAMESLRLAMKARSDPFLQNYELHGWVPDANLSDDVNFMDMILLLTRNSTLKQGGMACALVRPIASPSNPVPTPSDLLDSIISLSTNLPFYNDNESDIHSEIAAIGEVAMYGGRALIGATAYITMPPCKRCLMALHCAGISRIVTRLPCNNPIITDAAARHRIKFDVVPTTPEQQQRIQRLVGAPNPDRVQEDRKRRKEERKQRKEQGKRIRQEQNMPAASNDKHE